MNWYSVTTPKFKCPIAVENNVIVHSGPSLKRFIDDEIAILFNWLDSNFEDYKIEALKEEPEMEGDDVI